MRYVDARYGTNVVERVLEKYKAAIEHKGMIRSSGLFSDWWMVKQDLRVPADEAAFTAW